MNRLFPLFTKIMLPEPINTIFIAVRLLLYASKLDPCGKVFLQEGINDHDGQRGDKGLRCFGCAVRDKARRKNICRAHQGHIAIDNDRLQIALQRIICRTVHEQKPIEPAVPVRYKGKQGQRRNGRQRHRHYDLKQRPKMRRAVNVRRLQNRLRQLPEEIHENDHIVD